jgi:hypothetical protein
MLVSELLERLKALGEGPSRETHRRVGVASLFIDATVAVYLTDGKS